MPRGAPFARQRLQAREVAKILLRDDRATDPYTNSRLLRRLARAGFLDLLVDHTPGNAEHLAEHGVAAETVPIGYQPSLEETSASSATSTCSSWARSRCLEAGASSAGCGSRAWSITT